MSKLVDRFLSIFEPDPEPEQAEFDVTFLPLEGDYPNAKIVHAGVEHARTNGAPYVKVKCRLNPDDPDDQSIGWATLSGVNYVRLLKNLGLPRTNRVTVLIGRKVHVTVEMRPNPFSPDFQYAQVTLHQALLPKPSRPKQ